MFSKVHDIGAHLKGFNALNPAEVLAGTTTEDGIQVNGFILDRRVDGSDVSELFLTAKAILTYNGTLGATARTLTLAANAQHSDTTASSAFVDFDDIDGTTGQTVTVTRTTAGNAAPNDVLEFDLDLGSAKRYVRLQATPSLGGSTVDTIDYAGVLVLGFSDVLPPA